MYRIGPAIACLSLAVASPAAASVDICSDPKPHSRLAVEYVAFDDSSFDDVAATTDLAYQNFDLLLAPGNENLLFGIGYRYSIFDIESLPAATNGHLHTLFLPLHILAGNNDNKFRFSIAAASSASSNVFKEPGKYPGDVFQVLAAAVWTRHLSEQLGVQFGICGDHRFGEFEVYPTASLLWQPNANWHLQLGFPDSTLSYRFSDWFSSSLHIGPDGHEWYVEDSSRTFDSDFVYEAYLAELTFDWTFTKDFTLSAGIGRQFDNQYEFVLQDRSAVRLTSEPVTRISAAVEWRF